MGIAVPGAPAAKFAYPNRKVVAVTGDAGYDESGNRNRAPGRHADGRFDLE
jgi:hypothetical protein